LEPMGHKAGPFGEFIRRANVGIIVLDSWLLNDPAYHDDPEFQEFVAGKQADDFAFYDAPDTPVRIAVRRDLLAETPRTPPAAGD